MDLLQIMFASYRRLHAAFREPDATKFIVEIVQVGKLATENIMFEYPGDMPTHNPVIKFSKGPGETDEDLQGDLARYPIPASLPWVNFFTPYGIYSLIENPVESDANFSLKSPVRFSDEVPGLWKAITMNRSLPPDQRALLVAQLEEQLSIYPPTNPIR